MVAAKSAPKVASGVGASIAVIAAIVIGNAMPDRYVFGPGWVSHSATWALLVLLALKIFGRRRGIPTWLNEGAVLVIVCIILTINLLSLIRLIQLILYHVKDIDGLRLLGSSVVIWATNVIAFALLYWQLDGGGPDARINSDDWHADFAFPQPVRPADVNPNWQPNFMDYFFLSFTTSTAFSPTDTPPLTTRARTFMLIESAASLLTIAITAARAVNILS